MKRIYVALFLGLYLALMLPTALADSRDTSLSGNAIRGKTLYYDHGCFACHGYNGIGKHNIANDVSGIMTNEEIYLIFLRARSELNPPLPSQKMPHYPKASLPDREALDIFAYIKTFKDNPPSAKDARALSAIIEAAELQTKP